MSSGFVKPVETERFTDSSYEPLCNLLKRCQKLSRVVACSQARPGLEPGPFDLESSGLIIWPPRLPPTASTA